MSRRQSTPKGLLPPREAWLIDPDREKLDTPVNELGLIDVGQLMNDVRGAIDLSYEWQQDTIADRHHFYWPSSNYPFAAIGANAILCAFRNLPPHLGLMSREVHNWVHVATEPPPSPPQDVMEESVAAFAATRDLFSAARTYVSRRRHAERRASKQGIDLDETDIVALHSGHDEQLERVQLKLAAIAMIPPEFQLAPITQEQDPIEIARRLGKVAAPRALILTRAAVA